MSNSDTPADIIDSLPVDEKIVPSHTELQILETLFKQKQTGLNRILNNSKDVILVGLLYLVFCLPQVDSLIIKFVPSAENSIYILILIKMIAFMILYFVLKNWYLARKNK